jgi:GDSL-like Lipase/Acylhydrolase family
MRRRVAAALVASAAVAASVMLPEGAFALEAASCAVPDHLLNGDSGLKFVGAAVAERQRLSITVLGTGSSMLPGPEGAAIAYPARLEAALNQRLSGVPVKVVARTKNGQTADVMQRGLKDALIDGRPDLVIWQTGTVDAILRVEPDDFRVALDTGIEILHARRTDVILMNAQYSPRTESMIAVGPYLDEMRAVAQQREVPLFDRFAVMHYWADENVFDFSAGGRDTGLAQRVHDCLGQALASLVIEAGRLGRFASKARP